MNTRTRNRILAAVAAALPVIGLATLPASAQTRVNQDGRALDANNRIGSDGSNASRNGIDRRGQTYTGNQVVTGNVTGARAFRGPVGYRDANEFSGPVGGTNIDRFVRDSTGAPTRTASRVDYGNSPTAFYGDTRSTPPPAGFRPDGFTGGYVNTGVGQQTVAGRSPYSQQTSTVFDSQTAMLRPGSVVFQSQDEQNRSRMIYASPLTGVMPLEPTMLGNDLPGTGMNAGTGTDRFDPRNPVDRSRMTPAEIQQMREELQGEEGQDGAAQQPDPNNLAQPLEAQPLNNEVGATQGGDTQGGRAATANRNQGAGAAADAGTGSRIDNRVGADRLNATGDVSTQQGLQRQLAIPPEKQSKLYAELQQRLQQQQNVDPATAEQNLRALRRAQDAGQDAAPGEPGAKPQQQKPGGARPMLPIPRGQGGAGKGAQPKGKAAPAAPAAKSAAPAAPAAEPAAPEAQPAAPAPVEQPAAARPAPLRIKSLAQGVEAKGLRDLLTDAEKLMKEGNYRSAIDKYVSAQQVAPNNPLLLLGQAQAELAAARYVSADEHLRQAIAADPALLMGQYDLESFIGRERLTFLVQDLKQMADSETTSPRPKVLLAYIAYGTQGLESAAGEYLAEAADRAGRPDPLIEAMRKHWVLPDASPPAAPEAEPAPAPQAAPADENK